MEIQYLAYMEKVELIKLQVGQRSFCFRTWTRPDTQTAAATKEVGDCLPWMANPKSHANPLPPVTLPEAWWVKEKWLALLQRGPEGHCRRWRLPKAGR